MLLTMERLTKQYGNKIAVDRISAQMHEGVYGLLGANGAGKTTLMRMLCGILTPTGGEVKLDGQNNVDMGEDFRALLGYLPQDFGYYPSFTAMEFLLFIASLKGVPKKSAKARAALLLEMVGLADTGKKKLRAFSGGMKQRLGIAQAVLNDPRILILDEPTAGLDPKERVRFRNLIADLARDKIVILSTHIVSDVEAIADEILMMKRGSLLMRGTVEEMVATMRGKVFTATVPANRADGLSQRFTVVGLRHMGRDAELRILSDGRPFEGATLAEPMLEDIYLHCFADEEVIP